MQSIPTHLREFGREDDGHDDTVDGNDFAEDDGDEILGSDAWGFHTAAEDGCASNEYAPSLISASYSLFFCFPKICTHHAAPTTESDMQRPMPMSAQA